MSRMLAIRVEAVTSSKSRFKLLPLMPSSSGKLVWGLFHPVYGSGHISRNSHFQDSFVQALFYVLGDMAVSNLDKILLHFTPVMPLHPRSKPFFVLFFKKHPPLLSLEKPDKYHYTKAQIKHYFFLSNYLCPRNSTMRKARSLIYKAQYKVEKTSTK